MRDLHAQLAAAIYQGVNCKYLLQSNRVDFEWKQSVARAQELVRKRKASITDFVAIARAIISRRRRKDWRICNWCGTPLLVGFYIDGELITRGKEFCGTYCRVYHHRRLVARAAPSSNG
jgi:hypothetical protein